ncbi:MAG: hypothetical protein QXT63_02180, partial [Thermoplasmata archaeon]
TLENKIKEVSNLEYTVNMLEGKIELTKEKLSHTKSLRKSLGSEIEYIERDIEKYKEDKKELDNRISELEMDHKIHLYTKDVFSKKGVRLTYILRYLKYLQQYTNMVLERLSMGKMSLTVSMNQKMPDRIDLTINNCGKEVTYESCSDGERHKIDLSFALGMVRMMDHLSPVSIGSMFLDEIMDISLDEVGQELLFEVLNTLKTKSKTIVVISHQVPLQSLFRNVWRLENGRLEF